jgi:uncharacterized membrane protein
MYVSGNKTADNNILKFPLLLIPMFLISHCLSGVKLTKFNIMGDLINSIYLWTEYW